MPIPQDALSQPRRHGKLNHYCKMQGGFVVARLSNGTYDWFPSGQPPHINGNKDHGAVIIERWYWNHTNWRKVELQPVE